MPEHMEDIQHRYIDLGRSAWNSCGAIFDAPAAHQQLAVLEEKVSDAKFWQDQEKAQAVLQQRKVIEDRVTAEDTLNRKMSDVETYFHLAEEEKDDAQRASLLEDVAKEIAAADAYVSGLETKTLLAGENDRLNAIVTIKPGAGGTESQDWAEMLLRMYMRWSEQKGFRASLVDSTPGEEAGIKSATVLIEGENAYGMLVGESGVHRLVRISPFAPAATATHLPHPFLSFLKLTTRSKSTSAPKICASTLFAPAATAARTSTKSNPLSASRICRAA